MLNKIFLVLTFLFLNYSALAEDIKDFEIEGVSIGDSMLEHFTKDEIELNNLTADFKDKSVQGLLFQNIDFIVNYDAMQFVYKIKNMEIINITAMNHFKDNINLCKKKKKEIVRELSEMFSGATRTNEVTIHPADPSGKSKVISTYFDFNNEDFAAVECEQWSKETGHPYVLKVSLRTQLYNTILQKEYN